MRSLLAVAALALLSSSCLNYTYARVVAFRPPKQVAVESLVVGRSQLPECLERLGAPLIVQEYQAGCAMAWGWFEAEDWNVSISAPIGDDSGSVSFRSVDGRMRGLLLIFDEDWTLLTLRSGFLRELGESLERRRPVLLPE